MSAEKENRLVFKRDESFHEDRTATLNGGFRQSADIQHFSAIGANDPNAEPRPVIPSARVDPKTGKPILTNQSVL
jgi:hypothetical protein